MNKIYKSKIGDKLFFYISSLLILNFIIIVFITNLFLKPFILLNKEEYLEDILIQLQETQLNSTKFNEILENIKYEDIYVNYYNTSLNQMIYPQNNKTQISSKLLEKLNTLDSDSIVILPSDELEEDLFNLTSRHFQITLITRNKNSINQVIILQTPFAPIVSLSDIIVKFTFLTSLLVFMISIIPSTFFACFISKPIKEATLVARAIKNKDFSKKCIIRTNDEIAELSDTLNLMTDSIVSYMDELKAINKELNLDINNRKKIEAAQKEFIANVSHEMKTPISIISGYTEGLKNGLASTPEETNEFYNIILDECSRMNIIIKELLKLSKLENGSDMMTCSSFNINDLCKSIITKFTLKCTNNLIELKLNADNEYDVFADPIKIEQVLMNYMQNAFTHVFEKGTISINISKKDEYIYIGINNDGEKIPEQEISNLWNKFYKIDKSHKRENNSTGLGLSIVKAIMNLHETPYGVTNTPNGVEFYIELTPSEPPSA